MSSIGAMFAPHHEEVANELVRVCRPGGTIGLLSWTPEGMLGALFRTMGPFAPPPPPGAQPPPLWGSEDHVHELFDDRVEFRTLKGRRRTLTRLARTRQRCHCVRHLSHPLGAAQPPCICCAFFVMTSSVTFSSSAGLN